MRKKIYLHVGYPKTATSAFQKFLFPSVGCVSYIGKFEGKAKRFASPGLENVLYSASTMKKEEFAKLKIPLDIIDLTSTQFLISDETLLFNIFRPSLWRSEAIGIEDVVSNLRVLQISLGVEFHIIITIRNQLEMLTSMYAQCYNSCYSRMESTSTFDEFFKYFERSPKMVEALNYTYVLKCFSESFSKVDLLVYEELKMEGGQFMAKVSDVFGEDLSTVNIGFDNVRQGEGFKNVDEYTLSDYVGALRQKVGFLRQIKVPWLRRALQKIKIKDMSQLSTTVCLNDEQILVLNNIYGCSNRDLFMGIDLDSELLGYPTGL